MENHSEVNTTVFVTGGSSILGQSICRELVSAGYTVYNFDVTKSQIDGVVHVPLDYANHQSLSMLKLLKPHTVIHLMNDPSDCPADAYGNNLAKTILLMNAAVTAGVKYFLYASSQTVDNPSSWSLDTSNKQIVEQLLLDYTNYYAGFCSCSLRLSTVSGCDTSHLHSYVSAPMQDPVYVQVRSALRGEHITLSDSAIANRADGMDIVHVSDAARAFVAALQHIKQERHLLDSNKDSEFWLATSISFDVRTGSVMHDYELYSSVLSHTNSDVPMHVLNRSCTYNVQYTGEPDFVQGWEPIICVDNIINDTIQLVKHLENIK